MIDRYLLRYFLAVIDHGNFSRAAQRCHVSQPTLSVGIAKLEMLLDRKLFLRTNRRVELTIAGSRFAIHARKIEAEFAQAERPVGDDLSKRGLRLGIIATLPAVLIEKALVAVQRIGNGDRLEIVEARARDLLPLLDRDRIDAVLGIVTDHKRQHIPIFKEEYAVAMASSHPLAKHESVSAEALVNEPMIVRRHCEALPEISAFFTSRGVRPFMAARTMSDEHAVAYVRAGLGITVMPRCFGRPGMAMPTLAGFTLSRSIGFMFGLGDAKRLIENQSVQYFANAIGTGVHR